MLALEVNGTVLTLVQLKNRKWAIMQSEVHHANVTVTGNPEWHTDEDGYHFLRTCEADELVCAVRTPDDVRVLGHTTRDFTSLLHTPQGEMTVPYCYYTPRKNYPYYAWGGYLGIEGQPLFHVYELDVVTLPNGIVSHLRDALVICALDQGILQLQT